MRRLCRKYVGAKGIDSRRHVVIINPETTEFIGFTNASDILLFMSETLDEDFLEEQPVNLTDSEIFTEIWTSPRRVFKYIHERRYDKYVAVLLILSGIAGALNRAEMKDMGDDQSLTMIILMSVFAGAFFGWLGVYMYAFLVSWTGTWLGASGNTGSIVRVLAYASVPSVVAMVFIIPPIMVYGIENFKSDGDITSAGIVENIFVYGSMFFEFVLGTWSIVLSVVAISVVQKLSIGKSILNALLPVVIIAIPILLIVLLVS